MKHTIVKWLVAFAVVAGPSWARGEGPPLDPFAITLSLGWQSRCRTGQWNPVEIVVSSQTDKPFIGNLELSVAQDNQHYLVVQRPIVLPAAQSLKIPLAVKFSYASDSCRVRLVDQHGYTVYDQRYELFNYQASQGGLKLVNPNQILFGLAGKPGLLITCPGKLNEKQERFITCNAFLQNLPLAWTGYCGLDALILYDPDWSLISPPQQQALAQWVSNGGQLMIILGSKPIPPDSPIGKLIPFTISSPRNTLISPEALDGLGIKTPKTLDLPLWKFPPEPFNPGWSAVQVNPTGDPLEMKGSVGFGRLLLLGFDPKQLPFNLDEQNQAFWMTHLKLLVDADRLTEEKDENAYPGGGFGPRGYYGGGEGSPETAGVNNILSHLMSISELEPISIWWILAILGTMALLIGPVDYMILKRMNRLPWTYLTFMSVLAVFTVGAYFGVEFLRAGDNQLRRLCVLDKIDGSGHCWQSGYTGIFASRSDDYLVTGFSGESWWSGITPAQGYSYYGNQGIKSTIECFQQEGNVPVGLPVNIWSMRTLLDEQRGAGFPLAVKVSFDGNAISARIKNSGVVSVKAGAIRFKDQWWDFGPVEPGQTVTVTGNPKFSPNLTWVKNEKENPQNYMYNDHRTLLPWLVLSATGTAARTRGIEEYHRNGAAVVYAMTDGAASCPLSIKGKKSVVHNTWYFRLVIPKVQTGSLQ